MAKVMKQTLGVITEVRRADGTAWPEEDWRQSFVGIPGIIALCMSERNLHRPQFVHFEGLTSCMHTGFGELVEKDEMLSITTRNSRYTFKRFSPWFDTCSEDTDDSPGEADRQLEQ